MANKDILISQIDQFIIDYGMLPYGGIPSIRTIMVGYGDQAGILETLPAGMTFTDQDIVDTANYFVTKYPGYPNHTYQDWYDMMYQSQYLADRIISGNGDGNGNGTTPVSGGLSSTMLLIGGAILLLFMMSKSGGSEEV